MGREEMAMRTLENLPLPWILCRDHEDVGVPRWQLDPEDVAEYESRPYVRIEAANGERVTNNHDLFEFEDPGVARLLAAAPVLLQALELANRGYLSAETRAVVRAALRLARGEP